MTKKLDINVGEVYSTDLYGDVEVLEYTNSAKVKIRFKDTGSERYTEIRYLRSGKVRDISVENKVKLRNAEYVKSKNREDLLGKEFITKFCGKCKVIDYKGWNKVVVEFYEPNYITTCSKHALITGNLNNPFYPSVYGKGYRGVGKYKSGHKEVVILWNNLLKRVFDAECHVRQPTYKGTSVCEEWLDFQNFAEWCYSQKFFNAKDKNGKSYCLDKDILLKGNRRYSPETCCFVPNEINVLFTKRDACRGEFKIGVSLHKKTGKFQASVSLFGLTNSYIGLYTSPEEAFQAYKKVKESYVKEVAEKWKGLIDEKVYDTVIKFTVSSDD